jgi:hypothetical protein
MIPACIKKEYKQLKIRFLMAENLPNLDYMGTIDAFVSCGFGGKKYKSVAVTAKDNRAPLNYEFWIPL